MQQTVAPYQLKNKVRVVTAASLFDGHDAAINVMRRIIQSTGAEVIHLGHDRSVDEVVNCAIEEDVNAIAMTSYQGGHVEYFKYMKDLLKEKGAEHIKIFGGGGGVILPEEIEELHDYGIDRIYAPDDGRELGLQGMINDLLERSDFPIGESLNGEVRHLDRGDFQSIARLISASENFPEQCKEELKSIDKKAAEMDVPVLGITGTGGSGKSSLIDELVRRYLIDQAEDHMIGVISVDPSRRKTGGALLGDRIRMNAINSPRAYMRSLATRQSNLALSNYVKESVNILKAAGFDMIILETSGIGQSDTEIVDHSDASLYVMTPEYGAPSQLEKIDMLDFADLIGINKFDKSGAYDAIKDVRKQYKRNHKMFEAAEEELPIYGTIASQFNDPGMNTLYRSMMDTIVDRTGKEALRSNFEPGRVQSEKTHIIPPERVRYLAEIAENNRQYDEWVEEQADIAQKMYGLKQSIDALKESGESEEVLGSLEKRYQQLEDKLARESKAILDEWEEKVQRYKAPEYVYQVRGKDIKVQTHTESLAGTQVPKVALPKFQAWGDLLRWNLQENVPGEFPYTAGVFPFKREGEDPTRMFAGEGGPEATNRRFHYISYGMPAARLSTAFDSVTLYGRDPAYRPDIYGKVGNSGVSVCCLDDAKKLYSGFDLADPKTSVSMTINGPASIIAAFFMNAAIDQQCEKYIKEQGMEEEVKEKIDAIFREKGAEQPTYKGELPEGNDGLGLMLLGVSGDQVLPKDTYERIKAETLPQVRGTVQADILKEDQAQNTCIFSTEFSLRLMGDTQQYFIDHGVKNFYSVSISGYHIAEAGANPITQLAFTLANGFTYIEYYLSRGMDIDAFAPSLSFFFSNGLDAEYAVIGRVARRIWAKALRERYGANPRSQKLKYHIQTSGRSLHAQEVSFNDIRTTLQALYAIYDNCNSLHTNAYDEAITTPTEESVRRAIAIQLIINNEMGTAKNENPNQGSFIIEELTDLVEEAVLCEFERLTERGGVLGAMENMYQRNKIQEESMYYERLKHNGDMKIIGVNTYQNDEGSPTVVPEEIIRSSKEQKENQINTVQALQERNADSAKEKIEAVQKAAVEEGNMFESLMEATKYCSLGQLTESMFEVGGQYRRNM